MSRTLVAFHAHPDDEALLTGGTLARASAQGHRVVLVVATAGEAGLAARRFGERGTLAARRLAELEASARLLGCARVELLGYADSGMDGNAPGDTFCHAVPDEAARRLAAILRAERADALTVYDPAGGYGHPDHRRVHDVGMHAATLAATPLVLEATVDRARLQRALRWLRHLAPTPPGFDPVYFDDAFSPPERITHRIDVRRFAAQKRAAMAAHLSQATGDGPERTLAACLRLPGPLFRLAFGIEWFVERGRQPSRPLLEDIFAGLPSPG